MRAGAVDAGDHRPAGPRARGRQPVGRDRL